MEFKWRDEQSVNITSDLSSFEDEEREAGDAPTTTLTQDVNVTNLAAGEVRTPNVSNPPNLCSSEPATGRISLSQPELPNKSTPPTRVARLMSSTESIFGPPGKPPLPYRVPLSETLKDNKRLREEIAVLKSKLDVEQYKVAELKSLQPREVQDILEEYYSLQMSKFDMAEERKQMVEERRQSKLEMERIEVRAQTKIEALERKLHESETKCHELEEYKERVRVLEAEIAKFDELPTSIDGLKGDDSEWTIRSERDIVLEELRRRLSAMEKENTPDETTLISELNCDIEALLQRIDHLEGCLRVKEEERSKISCTLVEYMARCHTLEKKIRNANLSSSNLSFTARNKEEVSGLNPSLKRVIAERESKLDVRHAALDEEQEKKNTSSALRRVMKRIQSLLKRKDGKKRCNTQDQLRCVEETNSRMAEVLSSFASDESRGGSTSANPLTAVVGVQTTALMSEMKSRDTQTDLTRTTLAQMECDVVNYSSDLDALRSVYTELREAIGQLVVGNIKPLPDKSDIASIEKSCEELLRLIHHERRRRENQAKELAAMRAKIEELGR